MPGSLSEVQAGLESEKNQKLAAEKEVEQLKRAQKQVRSHVVVIRLIRRNEFVDCRWQQRKAHSKSASIGHARKQISCGHSNQYVDRLFYFVLDRHNFIFNTDRQERPSR